MKPTGRQRSGCGCFGTAIFVVLAAVAIIGWPIYLDTNGASASGVITEKHESVRIHYGQWFRHFEIVADYSIPGQSLRHRAICDVDEKTFDSLHRGNTVTVHYFANLLNQPFLPATHLSPCSAMASVSLSPAAMRNVIASFVSLIAILFLWRVLRIRIAGWLLLPWLCLSFAYLALPRAEPEPRQPVSATATVDSIDTITTVGGRDNRKSIPLPSPYDIVRLKFTPPGMDTPVIAIDKVDVGSLPDLQPGRTASIVYDAAHPRIARLQAGTRLFPGRALLTVILCCIAYVVLVLIVALLRGLFHLFVPSPRSRAARSNAFVRARRWRL